MCGARCGVTWLEGMSVSASKELYPFGSLVWRSIGPHRGGRVVAVAGHPTQPGTFYFGGAAGGVWKSTSGGALWENVSDGFFKTAAVGSIAVAESDPNVIYVGTGETAIRSNVSHGDGVYKSTDGGASWTNVGLAATRHIGDILIHPSNPDIVYVAAFGHAWGPNPERGVYRTKDGGDSWELVLHTDDKSGAIDITWDPHNPRILYASLWEAQRYPHALTSGGEGSGIWKSTDGGDSWSDITRNEGLPQAGLLGKIGVAASPAKPGRVWAIIEHETEGAVYRSDDFGASWRKLSTESELRSRPWYYMHIYADPSDANTVWVLTTGCFKSSDGGATFETIPTPHGDNHDLWIDPRDSNRMIEGNDGGATVTFDGAQHWSSILNQPTAQFYHVVADDQVPYHVYGSQQDNWAMRLPSISFEGAISWKDYVEPGGGESGHIAISPKPPHIVYGGGIGTGAGHGRLLAWNPETRQARNVTVWPEAHGFGAGANMLKYRFQWTFPIEISPHDPDSVYITSNFVHRSTDEGTSWQTLSPDLTRNDPEKIQSSGGPITADNSGAEIYCTIFAFRESPHEKGVFWAGSDDGLVHISRDGGQTWDKITPPDLPEWAQIYTIEPSPHDKASAYLAATRYKLDDTRPYLYKTNDYGQTWTKIVAGIPDDEFTRVIREDPERRGLLYAGSETGVYVSFDDGGNWQRLESNLPVAPIHDLVIKDTDLLAATHGRAFWILDDVTPLRQQQPGASGTRLYQPRPATRYRHYGRAFGLTPDITNYKMTGPVTVAYTPKKLPTGGFSEAFLDAGQNPPDGAIVHYWLDSAPGEDEEVTLTFLDADGNELRSFSSKDEDAPKPSKLAGANRFVWNLRAAKPTALEGAEKPKGFAAMMEGAVAPKVVPGSYQVRLKVGDTEQTQPFEVLPDPRFAERAADIQAQYEIKSGIRDQLSEVHGTLNQLHKVKKQVEAWEERAKADNQEEIATRAAALKEQLTGIEGELVNLDDDKPKPGPAKLKEKLITLSIMVDESDHAPTQGAEEVYGHLSEDIVTQKARLQQVIADEVAKLNDLIAKAKLPPIGA